MIITPLDLAGVLGVPLYTKIVDSGGDSRRRRIQVGTGPSADHEISSLGVEGGDGILPEGRGPRLGHGERVRPGREQPYRGPTTLVGVAGSRMCLGPRCMAWASTPAV